MSTETRLGVVAVGITAALFFVLGVTLFLMQRGVPSSSNQSSPASQLNNPSPEPLPVSQGTGPQQRSPGPYPECEEILERLAKNENDPKSIEIVQWEGRSLGPSSPGATDRDTASITLRYRSRNAFGAIAIQRICFVFYKGRFTHAYNPDDVSTRRLAP